MARDMWTMINRELAKIEQEKGGRSDTPYLDVISETMQYAKENEGRRERKYSREIATVNAFETKIDRQIENATRSGNIYSEAEIADLRESIKSTYDTDSDRFSSLRSEFTDAYESRIDTLSEFSRRNKEWNNLESQVPLASENLLKLTEDLAGTEWDDLSQENKLAFKDKLMAQTQTVADLKRILKDPYNQSRKNYSQIGANISGIGNGKLALLTQLSTFDPGKVVITEGEMQAMTQAIQNDDPSLISAINNEGIKRKVERANMMEASIAKNVKEYDKLVAFYSDPYYVRQKKDKDDELKELEKSGKIIPDDFWMGHMEDGTEINLLDQTNELRKRQDDANDIDESYRRENLMGASYKESFNVEFPWDASPPLLFENDKNEGEVTGKVSKLTSKSFDDIVNYVSGFDTKKDIYKALKDQDIANYNSLAKNIVTLRNIETKYGKDSKEYKQAYNKYKKSYSPSDQLRSGFPFGLLKKKAGAIR